MKQLIMVATIVVCCFANARSEIEAATPPDLNTMSYQEASEVIGAEIRVIRTGQKKIDQQYIDSTVSELRHGKLSNEKKVLLIYLLGDLRLSQQNVIDALIESIDLRAGRVDPSFDMRRWGEYPAEEALIKIGAPTIDPILDRLATEDDKLRRQLMCNVIRQVLRRDFRPTAERKQ